MGKRRLGPRGLRWEKVHPHFALTAWLVLPPSLCHKVAISGRGCSAVYCGFGPCPSSFFNPVTVIFGKPLGEIQTAR